MLYLGKVNAIDVRKNTSINNSIDENTNESSNYSLNIKRVSVDANYITWDNVNDLNNAADLVVVANATKSFLDRKHVATYFDDGNVQDFYKLTDIQIERILKGKNDLLGKDKTLSIIEPVGLFENEQQKTILSRENYLELEKGNRSIIFLKKNSNGQYVIMNINNGKFSFTDEKSLKLVQKDEEINKHNEFKENVFDFYELLLK